MVNKKIIEVKDVEKTFNIGKVKVRAVRGVTFDVHEGDFLFIIGPSGSGKTTLLDMLGTLSNPTNGTIKIDGNYVSNLDKYESADLRRYKIGFVFQAFNLVTNLTCVENVLLPIIPTGKAKEYESKAKELLELMGLEHRFKHTPNELSGGEKQRVTIARAMVNNPSFVFADEPTGELDSKTGSNLMDYMRKVNKEFGTTFVIVTHDEEYIEKGDKVIILKDGKIEKKRNF